MKAAVRFVDSPRIINDDRQQLTLSTPLPSDEVSVISQQSNVKDRKTHAGVTPHNKKTEALQNQQMLASLLTMDTAMTVPPTPTQESIGDVNVQYVPVEVNKDGAINYSKLQSILGLTESPATGYSPNQTPRSTNRSRNSSICSIVSPYPSNETSPEDMRNAQSNGADAAVVEAMEGISSISTAASSSVSPESTAFSPAADAIAEASKADVKPQRPSPPSAAVSNAIPVVRFQDHCEENFNPNITSPPTTGASRTTLRKATPFAKAGDISTSDEMSPDSIEVQEKKGIIQQHHVKTAAASTPDSSVLSVSYSTGASLNLGTPQPNKTAPSIKPFRGSNSSGLSKSKVFTKQKTFAGERQYLPSTPPSIGTTTTAASEPVAYSVSSSADMSSPALLCRRGGVSLQRGPKIGKSSSTSDPLSLPSSTKTRQVSSVNTSVTSVPQSGSTGSKTKRGTTKSFQDVSSADQKSTVLSTAAVKPGLPAAAASHPERKKLPFNLPKAKRSNKSKRCTTKLLDTSHIQNIGSLDEISGEESCIQVAECRQQTSRVAEMSAISDAQVQSDEHIEQHEASAISILTSTSKNESGRKFVQRVCNVSIQCSGASLLLEDDNSYLSRQRPGAPVPPISDDSQSTAYRPNMMDISTMPLASASVDSFDAVINADGASPFTAIDDDNLFADLEDDDDSRHGIAAYAGLTHPAPMNTPPLPPKHHTPVFMSYRKVHNRTEARSDRQNDGSDEELEMGLADLLMSSPPPPIVTVPPHQRSNSSMGVDAKFLCSASSPITGCSKHISPRIGTAQRVKRTIFHVDECETSPSSTSTGTASNGSSKNLQPFDCTVVTDMAIADVHNGIDSFVTEQVIDESGVVDPRQQDTSLSFSTAAVTLAETTITLDQNHQLDTTFNSNVHQQGARLAVMPLKREKDSAQDIKEVTFESLPGEITTVSLSFCNRRKKLLRMHAHAMTMRFESKTQQHENIERCDDGGDVIADVFRVTPALLEVQPGEEDKLLITFAPPRGMIGVFSGALKIRSRRKSFVILLRGEAKSDTNVLHQQDQMKTAEMKTMLRQQSVLTPVTEEGSAPSISSNASDEWDEKFTALHLRITEMSKKVAESASKRDMSQNETQQNLTHSTVSHNASYLNTTFDHQGGISMPLQFPSTVLVQKRTYSGAYEASFALQCAPTEGNGSKQQPMGVVNLVPTESFIRLSKNTLHLTPGTEVMVEVVIDEHSKKLVETCRQALSNKSNPSGFFTTTVGYIQLHFQHAAGIAVKGTNHPMISTIPVNMTKSACFMLDKYQTEGLPTPVSQRKALGSTANTPVRQIENTTRTFTPFAQTHVYQSSVVQNKISTEVSRLSVMEVSHDQTVTSNTSTRPWTANVSHHQLPSNGITDCNNSFPHITSQQLIECKRGVFFRRECINFGAVAIGSLTRTKIELCNSTDEEMLVFLGDPALPFVLLHNEVRLRARSYVRIPVRYLPIHTGSNTTDLLAQTEDGRYHTKITLTGSAYA